MRKKLVVGNWKMHGNLKENKALLDEVMTGVAELRDASCGVCVPYPYLPSVQSILQSSHVAWGAQNISQYDKGAYTGEVSAAMLNDFHCKYVIVGHSERRALFGEDSNTVALKYAVTQRAGMVPILCVGETLEQREAGTTEQIIEEQLSVVMATSGVGSLSRAVVAYEPVWAIGTGKTATPQQAQDVHDFIRKRIASENVSVASDLVILYGGSVKANNAAELFAMPDIDGGLIGGASLIANEFIAICHALQS
mgnify:CR=1 FL=1|tara:strand:+ start:173 stop:928 length:756 start_codon:yes stop_codon:yes gene_type:complete